jgi:CrcB protein
MSVLFATAHSPTLGLAVLVAVAGGVGAMARAILIHEIGRRRTDPLPIGTVLVNASGSLVLGILTGCSLYHGLGPHQLSVAGIGLCGGYTTWSTASWESVHLVRNGHRTHALMYTFGGLATCLAAAAIGIGAVGLL